MGGRAGKRSSKDLTADQRDAGRSLASSGHLQLSVVSPDHQVNQTWEQNWVPELSRFLEAFLNDRGEKSSQFQLESCTNQTDVSHPIVVNATTQ